jgi:hypothetical protein
VIGEITGLLHSQLTTQQLRQRLFVWAFVHGHLVRFNASMIRLQGSQVPYRNCGRSPAGDANAFGAESREHACD